MELDQLLQTTSLDNDNSSVKYKRLGREINFYQGVSDRKKGGEGRECRNGNLVFHASSPPPPLQLSVKNDRPDNDCELVSLVRPNKTPAPQAN